MNYLTNAFSANMLQLRKGHIVEFDPISLDEARDRAEECLSIVGHADTAGLYTNVLEMPVVANRQSVELEDGDILIVGQYNGPRLPEGVTTLPKDATITWVRATISAK